MTGSVVDASVIIKALQQNELGHKDAVSFVDQQLLTGREMWVPDILFIEVANVMATKGESTRELIKASLEWVYSLHTRVWAPTQPDVLKSAVMAKKTGTAVFDMLYAVLAEKQKLELVTADEKFASKTGYNFVKVLGR